jgi:hypothetical protein
MDPTLGQVAIGDNAPDTSKFEIVCFSVGSSPVCDGTIGNGSTFCIRKECTVTSHKKLGNVVPCSGMLFVRKNQDSAFIVKLPQPQLRTRTYTQTGQSTLRATQVRAALSHAYGVTYQNRIRDKP